MPELTLAGKPVHTIFDLLGRRENDLTYSLGWALVHVPVFTHALLSDVFRASVGEVQAVNLQLSDAMGITDVEVLTNRAHLIIEAKRGWVVPTNEQLKKYVGRLSRTDLPHQSLLALTECTSVFARLRGLPETISEVPVDHRSWIEMVHLAEAATHGVGTHQERHLARQLVGYLKGVTTVQDVTSNMVYCVSIGSTYKEQQWTITPKEVLAQNIYFHPFGWKDAVWPKVPDNYLAFRWEGHIQEVRHVTGTEVVSDLHEVVPEIPRNPDPDRPFLVYRLGPPIPLPRPLPAGTDATGRRISYRNSRLRLALDLIFTASSIREALAETKARVPERMG